MNRLEKLCRPPLWLQLTGSFTFPDIYKHNASVEGMYVRHATKYNVLFVLKKNLTHRGDTQDLFNFEKGT